MRSIAKLGRVAFPVALVLVAGACSATTDNGRVVSASLQPFESCDAALAQLQYAAKQNVEQHEASKDKGWFGTEPTVQDAAPESSEAQPEPEHSETNVQVEGVDEPDIVKTNGERILTLTDDQLVVVDTATQEQSHALDLPFDDGFDEQYYGSQEPKMLVHEDRALVINQTQDDDGWSNYRSSPVANIKTTLVMIDLTDEPDIVNTYEFEGAFVDARGIDQTARLVMRSSPQLETDDPDDIVDAIDNSVIEDWLPQYRVNGETKNVGCEDLARPANYSGSSTLTILTFDLASSLDDGDPLSIEADGETVYATGDALYVANDRKKFKAQPMFSENQKDEISTEIYRFDISGTDKPVHESSAEVPGYLLSQYSMSEYDGHLRVATTHPSSSDEAKDDQSTSSVYLLKVGEASMKRVGEVNGLGVDERIFAVRFMGDRGYVVTFRQTDPLYTLDLSDPKNPEMTGELKITGYSAYLHPVLEDRLIGVGQEADTNGGRMGLQVSLFDVSDDSNPNRIDEYHVPGEISEIEFEPHAFLYWEPESLLAVPARGTDSGLRLLHVESDQLTEAAVIEDGSYKVKRTLVANGALWSLTKNALTAHDLDGYSEEAHVTLP